MTPTRFRHTERHWGLHDRLLFCATYISALALVGPSGGADAQESLLVVPPRLETAEGDDIVFVYAGTPANGFRAQYSYPASDFSGLPSGHNTIVSMGWRPDRSVTYSNAPQLDLELRLSTTSAVPGALSPTFADNVGQDETVVYSGHITFATDGAGPREGPRPFDYLIEFDRPFVYEPNLGNLLVDFKLLPPAEGTLFLDSQTTNLVQSVGETNASAPTATLTDDEIIPVQFTFIPDPSTVASWLQPGDANQDQAFDQYDIVQVLRAGKYLTGQPATWGDGDWNGAPGGEPGDPPAGNGRFDQLDIVAALRAGTYLTGPYAAFTQKRTPNQAAMADDVNGRELDMGPPPSEEWVSGSVAPATVTFAGNGPTVFGGPSNRLGTKEVFESAIGGILRDAGLPAVQRGPVDKFGVATLTTFGSLSAAVGQSDSEVVYVPVPEPSGGILALLGLVNVTLWLTLRGSVLAS